MSTFEALWQQVEHVFVIKDRAGLILLLAASRGWASQMLIGPAGNELAKDEVRLL